MNITGTLPEAGNLKLIITHACLGEVSHKIWVHDFVINNNGDSVPVIFISLDYP